MEADALSEEERRAMRGSKFAPLPTPTLSTRSQPRLAHPGGPLTTNKAAALAKFLERKLQQPGGLNSIDPDLLELAVKNAKETVIASTGGPSNSRTVRHVASFHDTSKDSLEEDNETERKQPKKKKKKVEHTVLNRINRKEENLRKRRRKRCKASKAIRVERGRTPSHDKNFLHARGRKGLVVMGFGTQSVGR